MPPTEALEGRLLLSRWTYVFGRTFTGTGTHESLELDGVSRRVYVDCRFTHGTTCCRCNRCRYLAFLGCTFDDPLGPADPDGSDLQFIDCGDAVVSHCTFRASPFASDLLSVYGDEPTPGSVTVEDDVFYGAGTADFSTSCCLDGPHCPPTAILNDRFVGARCGITVAGGVGHRVSGDAFRSCQTNVYVADLYGTPGFARHALLQ